jgi:hypothetical protein
MRSQLLFISLLVHVAVSGCGRTHYEPHLAPPNSAPRALASDAVMKVHLQTGEVIVADRWDADEAAEVMSIAGQRYNVARTMSVPGDYQVPFNSIALVEWRTRDVRRPAGLTLLPVYSVLQGAITILCVADPKSCFGSCPTFYLAGEEAAGRPVAEGFSASFARALEAPDLDALYGATADASGRFTLTMANEALETHAVRRARLLVVPRSINERVFATSDNRLIRATRNWAPSSCTGRDGDCLESIRRLDGIERHVAADSNDLAVRETVEITWPMPDDGNHDWGLVLAARQSFVTTYAFYQTMAHFGAGGGDFLARLERSGGSLVPAATGMANLLGGISVSMRHPDGQFVPVGKYDESGPIATDVRLLPLPPLPEGSSAVTVQLEMAQGNWRLDFAGLVRLEGEVTPLVLTPSAVERDGSHDERAAALLNDPDRHLVTYPGDRFRFHFQLPDSIQFADLFLDTEGFYYEWMRQAWLAEEDPALALMSLTNPSAMLRHLAPGFKAMEATIEAQFWASRFGRKP